MKVDSESSSAGELSDSARVDVRVQEIVEHARRPGRFLLTLSNGQVFTLSVALLSELGVTRVGIVVPPQALSQLESEADVLRAMDRAIGYLSRGRRTRRELERRLRQVRPGQVAIDVARIATALDRLTVSGLLSDEAVARAEASSRLRRGDGPRRVTQILQQKGITQRDAAAAVALASDEDGIDESAQCLAVAGRRMRSLAKLEPAVARRRLIGFLQRRGYSSTSIRLALAEHFGSR